MPRTSRSRLGRTRAWILAIFLGVQAPGVVALGILTGGWAVAVAAAALLSAPYLPQLVHPWAERKRSLAERVLLRIFFVWWAACLAGWLFGPLALVASKLLALPSRATFLSACALSLAAGVSAIWPRPRLVSRTIRVTNLPRAFDGFRIVHLSDVHCGPWTPERFVRKFVRRVNALGADLVAVTGDLITSGSAYVRTVARALGELRASDGVVACMGNHDYFTDGEALVRELESAGLVVLRNRGLTIQRGAEVLYVAGVDDTWTGRDDVAEALASRPAAARAVLLAHDPGLFPEAIAHGVDLTLSGHTHGGQVAVPGLARKLNLARIISRFSMGLYRQGSSALYVSRGLGTSGPPIRLGAPPEIAVLTLRPDRA